MRRRLNWTRWSQAQREPAAEPDWTEWLPSIAAVVAVALLWLLG
jgi:hypothetical protein